MPARMHLSVLLTVTIFAAVVVPVRSIHDFKPGCLSKCSDEVKCVVQFQPQCSHEERYDRRVASEPRNLEIFRSRDQEHKYIDLEWMPPDDGSYRDLKAFRVSVRFTNHGMEIPGDHGTQCYQVKIVDPKWVDIYSNTSVKFYLRCIRVSVKDWMTITLSVYSQPLKIDSPKLVSRTIETKPDDWDPDIQRWADTDDNVHIRIRNPHNDARFYKVTLFRLTSKSLKKAFERTFPAQHVHMKNETYSWTQADDKHYPHFVIKNVLPETNYSTRISALYVNKSEIPKTRIMTSEFVFNFTKRIQPSSPRTSSIQDNTDADAGVSVQLTVAIVIALVLFLCCVLVMWKKVKCQSTPLHPWLTCKLLRPYISNNTKDLPKIIPVYCEENEDFVRAVESHVSLLHRYVNVLPIPRLESGSDCCPAMSRPNQFSLTSEIKVTDVIIYLSPSLGHVSQSDQVHDLSRLDQYCRGTIQSVQNQQRTVRGEDLTIHIVTFDCFQKTELDCLPVISNIFSLDESLTATHPGSRSFPIKLAAFKQNSWKLERLDELLYHLCRVRDYPRELLPGVQGWHESPEAKQVELYLSKFGIPYSTDDCASSEVELDRSDVNPNSTCLDVEFTGVCCPSTQPCQDQNSRDEYKMTKIIERDGDKCHARVFGLPSNSSQDCESGCVSEDSIGFYTTAKGMFYTEMPPSICDHPKKLYVDISGCKSDKYVCAKYKDRSSSEKDDLSNPESENLCSQEDLVSCHIRPPPSLMLSQDHRGSECMTTTRCLAESESDNECSANSLESDTLLTEKHNSMDRKEVNGKYLLKNRTNNAISPPSSLVYTLRDSISDIIGANNSTKGWNTASYT